ncbi:MAG TPA: dihydroorotase [Acidobacteriota bacterium]|jgi:dihydroorotase|nr:dihydroorotase [Acidobacteriota bacterium]
MKILIRSAHIVDPESHWDGPGELLVDGGRIAELKKRLPARDDWEVVNAAGLILTPGLIDMHVHLREPGREDEETIESGCRGAVAGGFTSIACMPNTDPINDSETVTRFIVEKARAASLANVYPVGAISKGSRGEKLAEIGEMVKAGARAISDDGQPVMNAQLMRRAMEYACMFDIPVIDHCEDKTLAGGGAMNEGRTSARLGLRGIHCCAEDVQVSRDIILSEVTGAKIHIAHLSSCRSLELVAAARKKSVAVTCEVTPHHFTLADEDIVDYDTNFKMNPPLRERTDIKALLRGLADGTVDAIASDHAPHNPNEKMLDFESAPFGILGLETTLPLAITYLVRKKIIGWPRLVQLLSANPARILGLNEKGSLKKGNDADLTLIDPNVSWTIDGSRFHSKSRNTPFSGWNVYGCCMGTMVGGRWVFRASQQGKK